MSRKSKSGKSFNEWRKENLALVESRYKKEFIKEFRVVLKKFNSK